MRLSKITIICLAIAGLLTGGVLIAQATGFVTHENGDKIILWDNVRLVGQSLNISGAGTEPGNIYLGTDKDLYVKKFVGFDCANYPADPRCAVTLGDVGGNIFLKIAKVSGNNLALISSNGIRIIATSINLTGKLILSLQPDQTDPAPNLKVTDKLYPTNFTEKSVYADNLRVDEIGDNGTGLTLASTKMGQGAFFQTSKAINYIPPACPGSPSCP